MNALLTTPVNVEDSRGVLSALSKVRGPQTNGNYTALCPFHDDHNPSLSVHLQNGFTCFACGEKGSIKRLAQHLNLDSLSTPRNELGNEKPKEIVYDYGDFQAVRKDFQDGSKKFYFRRLSGDGKSWLHDLKGLKRVLYRQAEVENAPKVIIVEGEKCADALNSWLQEDGFLDDWVATTNPQGAKHWIEDYSRTLAGKAVIVLPDNDEAGHSHCEQVCRSLAGVAANLKVVELPNLPPKGDVVDFMKLGGDPSDIFKLANESAKWEASDEPALISVNSVISAKEQVVVPKPDVFYGLGGKIVRVIEPHTESDPMALMASLLAAFGNIIGRNPHFLVEANFQHSNLFVAIIGTSSKARKGTSWSHVESLFRKVEPNWIGARAPSGLSSGEGLIWNVRDPVLGKNKDGEEFVKDEGVEDKRLMIVETEFAQVLHCGRRDGNTLSTLIRRAWDTGDLRTLTKNSPLKSTNAHISIVAHCTEDELAQVLGGTDIVNGFSNRFLWIHAKRSKKLPNGGKVPESEMEPLLQQLKTAVEFASKANCIEWDTDANQLWCQNYDWLSSEYRGVLGSVTGRSEAQVIRVSILYALLDCSQVVRREHLIAALAFWQYALDSAKHIFGSSTGSKDADRILERLREKRAEGMTQTQISDLLNHPDKKRLDSALLVLTKGNLVYHEQKSTSKGRPTITWFACAEDCCGMALQSPEKSELTELSGVFEDEVIEVIL